MEENLQHDAARANNFCAYETIQERISVRSYSDRPLEENILQKIEEDMESLGSGPFGTTPRFKILDLEPLGKKEMKRFGTYGFIKGARLYILGAVKDNPGAMEDLGYCMEKVILKATSLGLGTCWLGGTFKRAAFARKMDLAADELLPAITPVGYPGDEQNPVDRLARLAAKSKKRKPWSELFFGPGGERPLTESEAGDYREALEALRLGPSASNRQPWRIARDEKGRFHLYLKENKLYNRLMGKIRLQNLDMGIAMCHFALTANEQGIPGSWRPETSAPKLSSLQYIASWVE